MTASKLNELAQAVKAIDEKATSALITDVEGGEFSRSSFGTVLMIPQITPGGGAKMIHGATMKRRRIRSK